MDIDKLKPILEALFAASDKPLTVNQLFELFVGDIEQPSKDEIRISKPGWCACGNRNRRAIRAL